MEHIPDTNMFLSEVYRVLKPGGYAVFSVPFIYGKHDCQDFYRWTSQGLGRVIKQNGMDVVVLKNRGGVFLSIITLISNFIHSKFMPSENGWRANGIGRKMYFGFMAIAMLPIIFLSWFALLLDLIIDRDSANTSGFILFTQKPEIENTSST